MKTSGRPPGDPARVKKSVILAPEQHRQLEQLKTRIFGGDSAVVATAIDRLYDQYKKDWPDDFK